jgi:hypothetical protein
MAWLAMAFTRGLKDNNNSNDNDKKTLIHCQYGASVRVFSGVSGIIDTEHRVRLVRGGVGAIDRLEEELIYPPPKANDQQHKYHGGGCGSGGGGGGVCCTLGTAVPSEAHHGL